MTSLKWPRPLKHVFSTLRLQIRICSITFVLMDQTVDVGRRETKTSINTRMESHSQLKFVEYTWFDTECERVFKRPYLRQMSKCTESIPKNMSAYVGILKMYHSLNFDQWLLRYLISNEVQLLPN